MTRPIVALFRHAISQWASSKGIWLVIAATLLPLILTGAWTATHQDDLAVTSVTWQPQAPVEGQNITITATVENTGPGRVAATNVTLAVGPVRGNQLIPRASTTQSIGSLGPGETTTVELDWTSQPGGFYVFARVDPDNEVSEIEEANNDLPKPIVVRYAQPSPDDAPALPGNLTGSEDATTTADLAVTDLNLPQTTPGPGENATLTATVTNQGPDPVSDATAVVRVARVLGGSPVTITEERRTVSLDPGQTETLELTWEASDGVRWIQAWIEAPETAHDPAADNQATQQSIVVQPAQPQQPPSPPERVTIKGFYLDVLNLLHLRLLLPFIALFYAAGVLTDEASAGNLAYLLTRPLPRWALPVAKFTAGFLVAGAATALGIVATFLLLFGTPAADLGFLTTPLLASMLTLLAYGALFTLLGVWVDRPYLIGAIFILGWETAAGLLVPWVSNLTLNHWIGQVLQAWPLDQGVVWLPEDGGTTPLLVLLGVTVVGLAAAGYLASTREYNVG